MTDGRNFFWSASKDDLKTYDNISKFAIGSRNDHTDGCLLNYRYFKEHELSVIDFSKQQALDADLKAMQQINFTGNLEQNFYY